MFAGSCNLGFTRMDEIKNGIAIQDVNGDSLGVKRERRGERKDRGARGGEREGREEQQTNWKHTGRRRAKCVQVSQAAGRLAVGQTVLTRCIVLPIVPLLLPPLAMSYLKTLPSVGRSKGLLVACELGLISLCFGLALPCALAVLPQRMAIPVSSLEPQFQNRTDKEGRKIDTVYANKGL